MTEIVLIDLSSIAHPIWHMSQAEPDPNAASQRIVARIRTLATGHQHVAICCDSGKSFRNELAPTYKANRPEQEAPLHHQITLAREQLEADGFQVWAVRGFEADDLIAAATARAVLQTEAQVLVVSADKDLLQLVRDPRVRVMNARDGAIFDSVAVKAKFGVTPDQMRDYLCLVGDASDNVKGAKDIGPKRAAGLLEKFASLDGIYEAIKQPVANRFTPALVTNLKEFAAVRKQTETLISLRADVEIPFEQLFVERVPREAALFDTFATEDDDVMQDHQPTPETATPEAPPPTEAAIASAPSVPNGGDSGHPSTPSGPTGIAVRGEVLDSDQTLSTPAEWERQLDPRSMKDARVLAKDMYDSRMFSAYGTPQAVLSTVMVGRELGLPAMASLRSVHIIEGKHSLSADVMVAIVLRSGLAEFFEPISFSETEATFETKRMGARNPVRLTHTIEMAQKAWSKGNDAWQKSGWGRNPTDMLVARAKARLARMIYPDLMAGLYTPEELSEIREREQSTAAA